MVIGWGVGEADELGAERLIETSMMGRWVYEKYGWRAFAKIAYTTAKKESSDRWSRYEHELTLAILHYVASEKARLSRGQKAANAVGDGIERVAGFGPGNPLGIFKQREACW